MKREHRSAVRFLGAVLLAVHAELCSQIVLSEVMYDPLGPESSDEFIEIFNSSHSDTVSLEGWSVGDGTSSDVLADAGQGMELAPGCYAVILDSDYSFEKGSYRGVIPSDALCLAVRGSTLGSRGLSNSREERVELSDRLGFIVAEYTYFPDNAPGYSDEKIVLSGGDGVENWAESRVLLGTPGRENSCRETGESFTVSLEVDPNPFSPDGDGFEDETKIRIRSLNPGSRISLRIFDVSGRSVCILRAGYSSRTEETVTWDGRDARGCCCPSGIYIVLLEVLDAENGRRFVKKSAAVLAGND